MTMVRAALLTAMLLCGPGPDAAQAMMAGESAEQRGVAADLIARGRVRQVVSRWTADRTAIYTDVHLVVDRVAKDRRATPSQGSLVFRLPGGQVGDIVMTATDIAIPRVGEELVVLLAPAAAAGPASGLSADGAPGQGDEVLGVYPVRAGRVVVDGHELGADDLMATLAGPARP